MSPLPPGESPKHAVSLGHPAQRTERLGFCATIRFHVGRTSSLIVSRLIPTFHAPRMT